LLRRWLAGGAVLAAGAGYATCVEPFWLDVHDYPVKIAGLPASFEGHRVVQLTDLHAGDEVPLSYLSRVVQKVNEIKPDTVLVTGDLVTHSPDVLRWVNPICDLIGQIRSRVFVSFGNHDYSVCSVDLSAPVESSAAMERRLSQHGCIVLRNSAYGLEHADGRVWFVGFEDLWAGRFNQQVGFAHVNLKEPVICLSHNPDTAATLDAYKPSLILSGHTHGGQVRLPLIGAPVLNIQDRRLQAGHFQLNHSQLYVSRGVGYLARVRFMCRPELPCFVLSRA
jgi:hypothetical protein